MKEFSVSEIFGPVQEGEGPFYSGYPTLYVRFARCNLSCPGFNNPTNVDPSTPEVLGFDPKRIKLLDEMPMITVGCDSQYAVHEQFSHLWSKMTASAIAEDLKNRLPTGTWIHEKTKQPYVLSLTGGEPMLYAKQWFEILSHESMNDLQIVIIETNGTVPPAPSLRNDIASWLAKDSRRRWVWSVSPKLSASGESWDAAIRPKAIGCMLSDYVVTYETDYAEENFDVSDQVQFYLKFVVGDSDRDFAEVETALEQYVQEVGRYPTVSVMPMACTSEQQQEIIQGVANRAVQRGWHMSVRLQNVIWGNTVGK